MDLASASTVLTTSLSTSIPANESVLVLNRTTRSRARTGDPIWSLRLETPGQPVQRFDAVSGRAHRQNADRHRSGTRAPLPAGRYSLGPVEPLGPADPRELGPIWIGIEPQFLRAEAAWAFISTPVPTAMPTAARSAVSA